jgi:aminoglycoside phosphotransferase family enzyme/predicted kinase
MSGVAQSVSPLILALQNPTVYPHPVDTVHVMETHISWIILTGKIAYKIKKPVHFNFVDFSTPEKRQYYCEEELKLNKACAAPIYKAVVPLYGSATSPSFISNGKPPFEYAVQMQEFSQEALLLPLLSHLDVTEQTLLINKVAAYLSDFHQQCPYAPPFSPYGDPNHTVYQPIQDNIADIQRFSTDQNIQDTNARIAAWSEQQYTALLPLFSDRKADAFVRHCHGDLHLDNILSINGVIYCFDRLEFNLELQWIDVMSDLAFLLMDLEFHGFKILSHSLLNAYMNYSHDYDGLPLLIFYKAYRAMVRAKIALLASPPKTAETQAYLDYTDRLIQQSTPQLILTHGFSGSGKSQLSTALAPHLSCIVLRSDIYRHNKRFKRVETDPAYTQEHINAVYEGLFTLTDSLLKQGQNVWVDATFLKQSHRDKFISLAENIKISWAIVDVQAPYALLSERLAKRPLSEATVQVLEQQISQHDPLTLKEKTHAVTVDMGTQTSNNILITRLQEALSR